KDANFTNPSGALIKAAMIHGTTNLSGGLVSVGGYGVRIPSHPNIYSGYGLVALNRVLKFNDSDFNLFAIDKKPIQTGEKHIYCFRTLGKTGFRATLVWYDPPGSPGVSKTLVNDIDLVTYDGLYTYYGNGAPDHVNPSEQSTIDSTSGDRT